MKFSPYNITRFEDSKTTSRRFLWIILALFLLLAVVGCAVWFTGEGRTSKTRPAVKKATAAESEQGKGAEPPVIHEEVPNAARFYTYAGIPKPTTFKYPITVLTNKAYLVGYCEKKQNPLWGCYRLFKVANLAAPKRPASFKTDMRTQSRVNTKDYTSSGYQRGHLGAPNYAIAICYGAEAQAETFLMSNVTPQLPRMNEDVFENMERLEIREYAQNFEEIWIISGCMFDDKIETLKSGVEIPDACYHVVVDEENGKVRVLAFLIPQNVTGKEQLSTFLTSVDDIEKKAGLDLLSDLPDDVEDKVEAEKAGMW